MSTVQNTRPINLDYKSTPTVHEFRPALLTILAVLGIVISLADVCMQLWIWYQQLRSQYPRMNTGSAWATAYAYGIILLAFANSLVLFGSSMCLLSLRPWVRPALLTYASASVVMILLNGILPSIVQSQLALGGGAVAALSVSTMIQHPFMVFVSWFNRPSVFLGAAALVWAHLILVVVAAFLPGTKFAFKKGTEYLHTAYTSLAGR